MDREAIARWPWLALVACVVACDGDGCHGGPDGAASRFCQGEIRRLHVPSSERARVCRACCVQEVPYEGRIEGGVCVCR